jgi:hypothetical protein
MDYISQGEGVKRRLARTRRQLSAKLREMMDECRIMLSVADVSELAAGLSKPPARLTGDKRH